jgi:hypothetical protein
MTRFDLIKKYERRKAEEKINILQIISTIGISLNLILGAE